MSNPLTVAEPEVGFRIVHSIETVVVFPAPLGPRSPKISPDSTLMSKLSTALIELYAFVSCLVSMACCILTFSLFSNETLARFKFICEDQQEIEKKLKEPKR
jgi:hypothetical protein